MLRFEHRKLFVVTQAPYSSDMASRAGPRSRSRAILRGLVSRGN